MWDKVFEEFHFVSVLCHYLVWTYQYYDTGHQNKAFGIFCQYTGPLIYRKMYLNLVSKSSWSIQRFVRSLSKQRCLKY